MTVMIDIPPTIESAVQANAQAKGVSVEMYLLGLVERHVIVAPLGSESWTLQDALDYAGPLPENLGRATAFASETTFAKFWNSPEDKAAWRDL